PGGSLLFQEFSPLVQPIAAPFDFAGLAHSARDCAVPSSVRISGMLLSCGVGDTTHRFVQLQPTASGERFDPSLALEFFDARDRSLGTVGLGMDARAGQPWAVNTSWLVGSDSLATFVESRPDARFDVRPDTAGGRVVLSRRAPHDASLREVVQELRWGPGLPTPAPGQSLLRFGEDDYRVF